MSEISGNNHLILGLYCRFRSELRRYAAKCGAGVSVDDIVHQTFINSYDKISELHSPQQQRAYLYTTVRNLCYNARRNTHIEYTDDTRHLATEIVLLDSHDYLYQIIGKLPRREREVLQLSLQGYNSREIAEALHIGQTTVKDYKKEAYAKIRAELQQESEDLYDD